MESSLNIMILRQPHESTYIDLNSIDHLDVQIIYDTVKSIMTYYTL